MMKSEKIVKEWIEKAEEDFGFASSSLDLKNILHRFAFIFNRQLKNISKLSSLLMN